MRSIESSPDQKARELWLRNEAVLENVLSGREVDPDDYTRAIDFFNTTTGIKAREFNTMIGGRLPSEHLVEDLEAWRAWYEENKKVIYFDEESKRVRVDKDRKNARQE